MKIRGYILIILLMIWLVATAEAQPLIVYENKCLVESWDCLNETQAAKRVEIRKQVNEACKGFKCKKIISIDPKRVRDGYLFGAWRRGKSIYFAAMPGCKNAIRELRALLRSMNA